MPNHPRDLEMLRVLEAGVADDSRAHNRQLAQLRGQLAPGLHQHHERVARIEEQVGHERERRPVVARRTGRSAGLGDGIAVPEELFVQLADFRRGFSLADLA
jgi:hypothetical protein